MGTRSEDIDRAAREAAPIVSEHTHRTPVSLSNYLSEASGSDVYLKLENLQKTGAFKIRGALNACWRASQTGSKLIVASSAGNHAQGVAYSCKALGLTAHVFMPEFAYPNKVEATMSYGAKVHQVGETYDDCYEKAVEFATKEGGTFIHPFDDLKVIAGQGTIALELLEQAPQLDVLIVPVGGGGLIAGVASVFKRSSPSTKIVGVQSKEYPAFCESFRQGKRVDVRRGVTIADGISVKRPGKITLEVALDTVDDMVAVSDNDIVRAMFTLLERGKMVTEPAGAAGVAALLSNQIDVSGKKVGIIVSGGNVNPLLLARIITQSLRESKRLTRLSVNIPDRPGALRTVLGCVASARANVVDLAHIRQEPDVPPSMARVEIMLEAVEGESFNKIRECLSSKGLSFEIH